MRRKDAAPSRIDGLNPDDPGMGMLARAVVGVPAREILLVCCGDVPGVGADATRLVLDVRERGGSIARVVPISEDPMDGRAEGFGHALVWPRPHLGKDFTQLCLARGALTLREGGTLWCAARKAKGAQSLTDAIGGLMGEVDVVDRGKGYRLMRARKGSAFDEAAARAIVQVRYAIDDPVLEGVSLRSAPGVFSRKELDAGTRQLIEHAAGLEMTPKVVLDLGCGVGPLGLWAAKRWSGAQVLAVDSNLLAVALTRENADRNGVADRVRVLASDGLPDADVPPAWLAHRGAVELALVNPPTHAEPAVLGRMAKQLGAWLAPGAPALLVVNRPGRMTEQLQRNGAQVQVHTYDRYCVLQARWPAHD